MHDYLRAIGFSKVHCKEDLAKLLDMIIHEPEQAYEVSDGRHTYGERSRDFIADAGITVRGDVDAQGTFGYDYYFPYYKGHQVSLTEDVCVEKLAEREDYDGICDVMDMGVSLIFHMNQLMDYGSLRTGENRIPNGSVKLSALSIKGMVILPLVKTEAQRLRKRKEEDARKGMIAAARQGDQEAMENLTLEDIDLYTSISKRLQNEDVLSIVESYFMPYGIACDHYSVMGEIVSVESLCNDLTQEQIYQMVIVCNGMTIDLCINKADLLGEPQAGRRFRGNIWLQGQLELM